MSYSFNPAVKFYVISAAIVYTSKPAIMWKSSEVNFTPSLSAKTTDSTPSLSGKIENYVYNTQNTFALLVNMHRNSKTMLIDEHVKYVLLGDILGHLYEYIHCFYR